MISMPEPTDEESSAALDLGRLSGQLRIAIAHEWVAAWAGSEKTFHELARLLPSADLYTLTANPRLAGGFDARRLHTSCLDRRLLRNMRWATLPLMPRAWRAITRQPYDLVLTSTHAFAREFFPAREALHLSYCYTPARYVWWPELDKRGRLLGRRLRRALQRVDLRSLEYVDSFACISSAVRERIQKIYRREARVIAPPVNTNIFHLPSDDARGDYLLAYSRFVSYKALDLAIGAAAELGERLIIAGFGPRERELRLCADRLSANVSFVIAPSDAQLCQMVQQAKAVVFCANEDFGIVPVEAQACGTPVTALAAGGALDTVVPGVTGQFATEATSEAFAEAIQATLALEVDRGTLRANAIRFSSRQFRLSVANWILETVAPYPG